MDCSYDELKEAVKDEFNYWYYKIGVSEESVGDVMMDDYADPTEISMGEKFCTLTILFMIYLEKDLYSARILILMNELLKSKEEIQQELGEDYKRLLEEIDIIMDKYWRRVEAMSLHELMALYRRNE